MPLQKGTKEYRDHIVKLAAIGASIAAQPDFDPREMDDGDWRNTRNALSLLAEGFTLLLGEAGDKPVFRIPASRAT